MQLGLLAWPRLHGQPVLGVRPLAESSESGARGAGFTSRNTQRLPEIAGANTPTQDSDSSADEHAPAAGSSSRGTLSGAEVAHLHKRSLRGGGGERRNPSIRPLVWCRTPHTHTHTPLPRRGAAPGPYLSLGLCRCPSGGGGIGLPHPPHKFTKPPD